MACGIPFEFHVDNRIPFRHFSFSFHCFGPVYVGMYSHPVLVSKVVSIPRFGLLLCSSLYMRSSCLIPVNPSSCPLFPFTHFIASLPNHIHPSLPYDVFLCHISSTRRLYRRGSVRNARDRKTHEFLLGNHQGCRREWGLVRLIRALLSHGTGLD